MKLEQESNFFWQQDGSETFEIVDVPSVTMLTSSTEVFYSHCFQTAQVIFYKF
jgi:hypothetical protein